MTGDGLHARGDPDQVRARRGVDDAGWELLPAGGVSRALPRDRSSYSVRLPAWRGFAAGRGDLRSVVFDGVQVEPTLDSLQAAADFALSSEVDGFVSVGGGVFDRHREVAADLVPHPAPAMDYVNAPIGGGRGAVRRSLPPHVPPRPPRHGSEATTVVVLDILDPRVKYSGISHRAVASVAGDRRSAAGGVDAGGGRRPRPGWTSSAMRPSPICRCRTPPGHAPSSPTTGRPIRAPTRSRTCGRRGARVRRRILRRAVDSATSRRARDDGRRRRWRRRLRLGGRAVPARVRVLDRGVKHSWVRPG